jgi:hypothetical protein
MRCGCLLARCSDRHFINFCVIIYSHQDLIMTSDPFARARLRKVLVIVILATIPCYCAGLVAILLAPSRIREANVTPTLTSSSTAVVFATQTSTIFTSLTPTGSSTPSQTPTSTSSATTTNTPTITQTPTISATPIPTNTPFLPPPTFTNTPIPLPTYTSLPALTSTPTLTVVPIINPNSNYNNWDTRTEPLTPQDHGY